MNECADKVLEAHQLEDLSLDLMRSAAPDGNMTSAMLPPVHSECSQKGFGCGEEDHRYVLVAL